MTDKKLYINLGEMGLSVVLVGEGWLFSWGRVLPRVGQPRMLGCPTRG